MDNSEVVFANKKQAKGRGINFYELEECLLYMVASIIYQAAETQAVKKHLTRERDREPLTSTSTYGGCWRSYARLSNTVPIGWLISHSGYLPSSHN